MSSHSFDYVKITPIAKDLSSFVDLKQVAQELSLTTSECVLLSGDRGVFILELGQKIWSVSQLTSQQFASLTYQQRLQILSYMTRYPNLLEGHLEHHPGRHQPAKHEESSSSNPLAVRPSEADQDFASEVRNMLTVDQPVE